MIGTALFVLIVILLIIYNAIVEKSNYWRKLKIPYLKPLPLLGNYGDYVLMKRYFGEVAQTICQKFPNAPYFGAFYGTEPTLMVQDPEVIKQIMTKDFYSCSGREISSYCDKEVFTKGLFFTSGDRWKLLRQNLTPLFSSSKMKNMFYLIENSCHGFESMLDREFRKNQIVRIRALFARFTMDSIGTCAFGVNTKTMDEVSDDNPFTYIGKSLFLETYYRGFKIIARAIWPAIFYGLGFKNFPVEVNTFFHKLMTDVFTERKYTPTARHDFVDLVLKFHEQKYLTGDRITSLKGEGEKITMNVDDDFLVAQCVIFFAGGFETSSTTLQYLLYELAKNPEAQDKLIEEVDEYLKRHNNKLEYICVTELPFVEACLSETLRLYPVFGVLTREVLEDYTLPCGAVLDKGVRIHIPVYHLHKNPVHFPEPEEYRPERFYGDEKENIKPYTYLPFGEGPRICIGMRFAKMQMMAGIVTFFKKYRVELAEGTPRRLNLGVKTIVTQPKELIQLKLVEREGWEQRILA
ncbi:cytochrome P450 6B2-like [Achroia grisella]|uniref:cytochrome P450 6B2-like n=1 Tax=Achroia grisella TaxID=688607 RepID=UPI0027D3171C|nr:cytochrome P450 6B2-like [Achroia grisella]